MVPGDRLLVWGMLSIDDMWYMSNSYADEKTNAWHGITKTSSRMNAATSASKTYLNFDVIQASKILHGVQHVVNFLQSLTECIKFTKDVILT